MRVAHERARLDAEGVVQLHDLEAVTMAANDQLPVRIAVAHRVAYSRQALRRAVAVRLDDLRGVHAPLVEHVGATVPRNPYWRCQGLTKPVQQRLG